tara:strand:- start:775 stop:1272 length:498 start_codon:yes stop_codon:yes gene_type:complete
MKENIEKVVDKVKGIAIPLMLLLLLMFAGEIFVVPMLQGITYGDVALDLVLSLIILFAIVLTFVYISKSMKDICDSISKEIAGFIAGESNDITVKTTRVIVYSVVLFVALRMVFPYVRNINEPVAGLFAIGVVAAVAWMLLKSGGALKMFNRSKKSDKKQIKKEE